jgi:hypothetical protein
MATSENQIFHDTKSNIAVRVFKSVAADAHVHAVIVTKTTHDSRYLIDSATLYDLSDATAIRHAIKMFDQHAEKIEAVRRAEVGLAGDYMIEAVRS